MPNEVKKVYDLRRQIFSSVKLSTLQFVSQIGLRLVSTVVLTRLLAPEIYGVFAIVLLYRYILEMFSDIGIRSVVLTKEGEVSQTFLQTCWTVSILRGVLIFLFSGLIALAIASIQAQGGFSPDSAYANSVLPGAIAALGGVSLIVGLQTTNRLVYEREMKFGLVTIGTVLSNVAGLIATIWLAWLLRSVWALVFGAYVQWCTLTIYSFFAFKGAPMRWSLDLSSLRIILARGKWIMGHSILNAMSQAADRLVLGLVLNSSMFGYYFIARQIVDIGVTFLNTVHVQMGLQVFSQIVSKSPEDFRSRYYKYRLFFDALAGVGAGSLFVMAQALVDLVFDDRYIEVGRMIELLVFGLLPIGALVLREAFSAERKFREVTYLNFVSTLTLWIGLGIAIWADSVSSALLVIALHRLPETAILLRRGAARDWIVPSREGLVFVFFGIGAAIGWLLLGIWELYL